MLHNLYSISLRNKIAIMLEFTHICYQNKHIDILIEVCDVVNLPMETQAVAEVKKFQKQRLKLK